MVIEIMYLQYRYLILIYCIVYEYSGKNIAYRCNLCVVIIGSVSPSSMSFDCYKAHLSTVVTFIQQYNFHLFLSFVTTTIFLIFPGHMIPIVFAILHTLFLSIFVFQKLSLFMDFIDSIKSSTLMAFF